MQVQELTEHRCTKCQTKGFKARLLFYGYIVAGTILQIKCPRCGSINVMEFKSPGDLMVDPGK